MSNLRNRYKRFKEWEQQPHQVAPLSEDHHECPTCGTHYEGNYCPRCGQSCKIARNSFKNALLLYLDVWGLGNRGMFRSIRDLILRPGYMIRDYLRGMQMAYFPPFKMFFLLCALTLLIDSGLNIQGINYDEQTEKEFQELFHLDEVTNNLKKERLEKSKEKEAEKKAKEQSGIKLTEKEKKKEKMDEMANQIIDDAFNWGENHLSVMFLASLLIFSVPLWLLFRHSPAIPDLRLSECFVAMVYITNMLAIYSIIPPLLCFSLKADLTYSLLTLLLAIIPIKQLSGYSYMSTIWRILVAFIPFIFTMVALFLASIFIMILYLKITV